MKDSTKKRKKATRGFKEAYGRDELNDRMYQIIARGKQGFDVFMKELGRMMAETIMYIEREEMSGHDYHPKSPDIRKWASQGGSVYIGDQKIRVEHPRLRGANGEMALESYKKLKSPDGFSEELLGKILRGMSCRKYSDTVIEAAGAFGISPSSVSSHIIETTKRQLKEFKERSLALFMPFAIFLDTIHRVERHL